MNTSPRIHSARSGGGRKANALRAGRGVEDGVVGAHEHIAQDPQRPGWRRQVQAHEARDALLLAARAHLRGASPGHDYAGAAPADTRADRRRPCAPSAGGLPLAGAARLRQPTATPSSARAGGAPPAGGCRACGLNARSSACFAAAACPAAQALALAGRWSPADSDALGRSAPKAQAEARAWGSLRSRRRRQPYARPTGTDSMGSVCKLVKRRGARLQHVLLGREVEGLARDRERDGGHGRDLGAVHHRLAAAKEGERVACAVQRADDLLLRLVVGQRNLRAAGGGASDCAAWPAQPCMLRPNPCPIVGNYHFACMHRPAKSSDRV